MESSQNPLAAYADINTFDALQPLGDESIPDVESAEQILLRMKRKSLEAEEIVVREKENSGLQVTQQICSFKEGEIDDSWTIVARRRPSYQQITDDISTPTTSTTCNSDQVDVAHKPRRIWRRVLCAVGTVAAAGVVSILLFKRRNKKNE